MTPAGPDGPEAEARARVGSVTAIAGRLGHGSRLLAALRDHRKRPDNVLGLLLRTLTREEIAVMEGRGCRADEWGLVQVAEDFDPFRVRRTHLVGRCVLGRFAGDLVVHAGMSLPTGIYDCTLIDCQVGNDCLLENVRFAAHVVVEPGSVLFDVGSITASGTTTFGCGQGLILGPETGGREVPVWAELGVDEAAVIARDRADTAGLGALREAVAAYLEALASPVCWLRRGAVVRHTTRVRDAWIGTGALVDRVIDLENVAVCSTAEEPTRITAGASVSSAVLQPGVQVSGSAIVRHAVLCEHSVVDQHAVVGHSLIGPNCVVAKGEVTSSLVGPFTGLHHQSLLIAAYWPTGKGNIAYGAMVGSNHTGRAPDQEAWPGEGCFFGLGCSVAYPADLAAAPYTILAAGVSTLPQRLAFPFSLVTTPAESVAEGRVPRAFNELLPGWGLYANAYAINRMELKFARRDRTSDGRIPYQVLRPPIIRQVVAALDRLETVDEIQEIYVEADIPGLGKNFLRESARKRALDAYRTVLRRYSLRVQLAAAEGHEQLPGSVELAGELADRFLAGLDLAARLHQLVVIEEENCRIVTASKVADDERGQRIIPGYADSHPAVAVDEVVRDACARVESTRERVEAVLTRLA